MPPRKKKRLFDDLSPEEKKIYQDRMLGIRMDARREIENFQPRSFFGEAVQRESDDFVQREAQFENAREQALRSQLRMHYTGPKRFIR